MFLWIEHNLRLDQKQEWLYLKTLHLKNVKKPVIKQHKIPKFHLILSDDTAGTVCFQRISTLLGKLGKIMVSYAM